MKVFLTCTMFQGKNLQNIARDSSLSKVAYDDKKTQAFLASCVSHSNADMINIGQKCKSVLKPYTHSLKVKQQLTCWIELKSSKHVPLLCRNVLVMGDASVVNLQKCHQIRRWSSKEDCFNL